MFTLRLRNAAHVRQFVIEETDSSGWIVREEVDSQVVRVARYLDWHRVERAQRELERHINALRELGWTEMA